MMRTTNILAMSATAVLLMASCSKDQVTQTNPGAPIQYNILTGSATKGVEVNATNSISTFRVIAKAATTSSLNFDDSYTLSSGSWVSDNNTAHYWPNDATEQMTFRAIAPSNPEAAFGATLTEETPGSDIYSISNFTVPIHASEQVDLVLAKTTTNRTSNLQVPLLFAHALTQVQLQASCGDPNMKVTVYGAKIYGLYGTSKLTFPTSDTKQYTTQGPNSDYRNLLDSAQVWNWRNHTGDVQQYMTGGTGNTSPVVLAADAASIMGTTVGGSDGGFMLIPQTVRAAWNPVDDANNNDMGGYIAVLCKIEKSNGTGGWDQLFPATGKTAGFTAVPFGGKSLQIGKKYTITLKFFTNGGGGGVIPPDKTDPSKPGDPDIDGGGNPGTPVFAPMSFTVSVSDWQTNHSNANQEETLQ